MKRARAADRNENIYKNGGAFRYGMFRCCFLRLWPPGTAGEEKQGFSQMPFIRFSIYIERNMDAKEKANPILEQLARNDSCHLSDDGA